MIKPQKPNFVFAFVGTVRDSNDVRVKIIILLSSTEFLSERQLSLRMQCRGACVAQLFK